MNTDDKNIYEKMENKKICPSCEKEISNEAKFCPNCGAVINASYEEEKIKVQENKQEDQSDEVNKNEKIEANHTVLNEIQPQMINSDIPMSLEECLEHDSYAKQILEWSNIVEKYGKILLVILIVAGVIISINEGFRLGYFLNLSSDKEFSIELFCISLISWGLGAFIEYCTYHVISLSLGGLARIVQNTKVSAAVSLYEANKTKNTSTVNPINSGNVNKRVNSMPFNPQSNIEKREDKLALLDKWKKEGLITEEEQNQKMENIR